MDQPDLSITERAARARRHALRAARAVTLSAALAGCSMSHGGGTDAGPMEDAGSEVVDSGPDPSCLTFEDANRSPECCDEMDGWWEDGRCLIAVEGPRVPPPMTA